MNDSKFHELTDNVLSLIDTQLDRYDGNADIDYEINAGVMTLSFENGSKIVINRQEPLHQIWLATPEAGYHFCYENQQWMCNRSGEEFWAVLSHACTSLTGESIKLSGS